MPWQFPWGPPTRAYDGRQPKIDYHRIQQIRTLTSVPLVLHGGSGVPPEMIRRAVTLPGGGISKVNFATDLEQAFLTAVGREERLTNAECLQLPKDVLERGLLQWRSWWKLRLLTTWEVRVRQWSCRSRMTAHAPFKQQGGDCCEG